MLCNWNITFRTLRLLLLLAHIGTDFSDPIIVHYSIVLRFVSTSIIGMIGMFWFWVYEVCFL